MRALARALLVAFAPACTSPEPPANRPAPHGGPAPHAVLEADGTVTLAAERFALDEPAAAARLGAALKSLAADLPTDAATLRIAVRAGTPFGRIERLMTVLEGAGIEDYRLDLGR